MSIDAHYASCHRIQCAALQDILPSPYGYQHDSSVDKPSAESGTEQRILRTWVCRQISTIETSPHRKHMSICITLCQRWRMASQCNSAARRLHRIVSTPVPSINVESWASALDGARCCLFASQLSSRTVYTGVLVLFLLPAAICVQSSLGLRERC